MGELQQRQTVLHTPQVVEHARQLAWSDSGNYVIQCILKHCSEEDRWDPTRTGFLSGASFPLSTQ